MIRTLWLLCVVFTLAGLSTGCGDNSNSQQEVNKKPVSGAKSKEVKDMVPRRK